MTDGLLLLHAFPLDASTWRAQVEAFGDRVPVVAPNIPGFGGTDLAGDVTTMDDIAARAVAELDAAGVQRAAVVGVSIGGYAAFALWRGHRDRLLGLVLADTKAEPDDEEGVARRRAVAERVRARGAGAFLEQPFPAFAETAPTELWDEMQAVVARQPPEAIARAALGMAERPDSRELLTEIDLPTICVVGEHDAITPVETVRSMAAAIGAELEVVADAGHVSYMERPEGFNRTIADLLDRCGL